MIHRPLFRRNYDFHIRAIFFFFQSHNYSISQTYSLFNFYQHGQIINELLISNSITKQNGELYRKIVFVAESDLSRTIVKIRTVVVLPQKQSRRMARYLRTSSPISNSNDVVFFFLMMKRGCLNLNAAPSSNEIRISFTIANARFNVFFSAIFHAVLHRGLLPELKQFSKAQYRRKILNRFEGTDEKYRPSRRDVEKGALISSLRHGADIYISRRFLSSCFSYFGNEKREHCRGRGDEQLTLDFFFFFSLHRLEPVSSIIVVIDIC